MIIDEKRFFEGVCKKCKQYTGDKPIFGKCLGDRMYSCARMRVFNSKEFEDYTGIKISEGNEYD